MSNDTDKLGSLSTFKSLSETHHRWGFFILIMTKKDPAFLFYPSDFLTGTMFMNNEQVGIYVRLLCSQHQHGGIIDKVSFNSMVGQNELIRTKFVETENGFYNIRLMEEMGLRNQKSNNMSKAALETWQKRKNTIVLKTDTIVKQKQNKSDSKVNKKNTIAILPEDINEVINYFIENGYKKEVAEKVYKYYSEAHWHDAKGSPVLNWKQKCQSVWFKEENKIKEQQHKQFEFNSPEDKESRRRAFQENI